MSPRRYLRLAQKIWLSNLGKLPHPFKLTFVVTKECHSKCVNCSIWKVRPANELSLEEIREFAKNSPFLSWVDFTGGEPTDRRDFADVIQAFVDNCPDLLLVHFPTNGLKTKRIAEVCERVRLNRSIRFVVTVSVDGPPEINDELRGIPGDFERAMETFDAISARSGVETYIGMTLYPRNASLVDETVRAIQRYLPRFQYRRLHVNIGHSSAHYYENRLERDEATSSLSESLFQLQKRRGLPHSPFSLLERIYHRKALTYLRTGKSPLPCAALLSSCFLSEDGTIYPCSIWDAPLGNIRQNGYSLVPILSSMETRARRDQITQEQCPHCWTPCEAYQTILANSVPRPMRRDL